MQCFTEKIETESSKFYLLKTFEKQNKYTAPNTLKKNDLRIVKK